MKEGTAIVIGLTLVGLLLQLTIGPLDWALFLWPANGITLIVLIIALLLFYLLRKRVYFFSFMATMQAAIPSIIAAALLTLIMGLTRQVASDKPCRRPHRTEQDAEFLAVHPCLFLDDNDYRRSHHQADSPLCMAQTTRHHKSFRTFHRPYVCNIRQCRHAETQDVL